MGRELDALARPLQEIEAQSQRRLSVDGELLVGHTRSTTASARTREAASDAADDRFAPLADPKLTIELAT